MPLNVKSVYPAEDPEFSSFPSRRSVVHSTEGMVVCTQPLAARCGLKILDMGGNCADAAVAVAAGLNLTEPMSTGIGGDMFCLFYDAKTKKVEAMNGSGRAPIKSTLEAVRKDLGLKDGEESNIPFLSVHAVTVPGAAAGWVDTIETFGSGKLSMEQILAPAIELAERGFPVSELCSVMASIPSSLLQVLMKVQWRKEEILLREASPNYGELLKSDPEGPGGYRAPCPGELFKNPNLAKTFRAVAKDGKKGFYEGPIAEAIIKVTKDRGGFLELEDLKQHMELGSEKVDPISYVFKGQGYGHTEGKYIDDISGQSNNETSNHGVELWEHPPNGQGIVALMALGIFEVLEESGTIPTFTASQHNSPEYLHALIESLRIAFADGSWWVADPAYSKIPASQLISKPYLRERAKLFNPQHASTKIYDHGSPAHNHSDTVYFACTDKHGNGISFINSNFEGFGSAIIPAGTGFVLQNRGANFRLSPPNHPNIIAPSKRPYHTIIPAMITNTSDNSLHSVYGVMGGFMQPQGQIQVLLNMIAFKLNPQAALDAPRFCIGAEGIPGDGKGRKVFLEDGISESTCEKLKSMGHDAIIVKGLKRSVFGRGQVVRSHVEDGKVVFSGGSDPRGDGAAFPG